MSSTRSAIRKACVSVIGDERATAGDKLKAAVILMRLETSAKKAKPRGRPFTKKSTTDAKDSSQRLERILSVIQ